MTPTLLLAHLDVTRPPIAGLPIEVHLRRLAAQAGAHPEQSPRPGAPALVLDARYPALTAHTIATLLAGLSIGDAVATRPDGAVLAAARRHADPADPGGALLPNPGDTRHPVGSSERYGTHEPGGRADAERAVVARVVAAHIAAGVHIVDPARTWIDSAVQIAPGVTVWPDVTLRGATVIGSEVEIRVGCWLADTHVGTGALLRPYCVCEGANLGPHTAAGPFAHLRPRAVLEEHVKVGNFVEVKNTTLRRGAKASHLTYLGDATVGADANIGAGTITCNYDGVAKHRTTIGAGAFIGSNSALVAPVTVGDGAIVGAGSVIAKDVPPDALALERSAQRTLEGQAPRIHARNRRRAAERERDDG